MGYKGGGEIRIYPDRFLLLMASYIIIGYNLESFVIIVFHTPGQVWLFCVSRFSLSL
jgi:hypothetical protein